MCTWPLQMFINVHSPFTSRELLCLCAYFKRQLSEKRGTFQNILMAHSTPKARDKWQPPSNVYLAVAMVLRNWTISSLASLFVMGLVVFVSSSYLLDVSAAVCCLYYSLWLPWSLGKSWKTIWRSGSANRALSLAFFCESFFKRNLNTYKSYVLKR